LGRVPHGYLLSQLNNKLVRAVELGINIFMWSGAVLIAYFTQSLVWMALWALVVQIAGMVTLFAIVASKVNFQWQVETTALRRMLSFSGFSFLESLAVSLFQQFDRILVGFVLGPAAAGVYSVGTSVALRLSIIAGQATEVMLPYASRKYSANEHTALYSTFRKASQIIALLVGTLAALLILWMDRILSLWISPEYAIKYTNIFRVLILAYFLISLSRIGHQTLTGMGKVKITSLTYLSTSILMLAGVYLSASRYGLIGAAITNLTMVLLLSFNLLVYLKFSKKISMKDIAKDLFFAVVIPFIAYGLTLRPIYSSTGIRIFTTLLLITIAAILLIKTDSIKRIIQPFFAKLPEFLRK